MSKRETVVPVGMVGLGNMGLPIALNLIRAEWGPVYGYDVVPAARERFGASGGLVSNTAEELFRVCQVVFFSLPTNDLVRENLERAVQCCQNGTVLVDTSSSVPAVIEGCAAAAAARDIALIDCPVSGGVEGASAGTLSAMCGGDQTAVDGVMPLLRTFTGRVTYMGRLGSGYTAKLVNNLIVGGEITLLAEAFGLARRAGLDLETLFEAVRGGAAGSAVLENKAPKMLSGDYTPQSRTAIHLKDQHNAQQLARSLGVETPMCDISTAILEKLFSAGRGNEDVAAVMDLF